MNVYEEITNRIIESLEAGIIPWRKEWTITGANRLPHNLSTGKPYRGVNLFTLLCSPYGSNAWMTYKQAQEMGAQVRKDEKGSPIVFWNFDRKRSAKTGEEYDVAFCRSYTVFNVDQIDGLQPALPFDLPVFNPIESAEQIAQGYLTSDHAPTLTHGGDRAYYVPARDHVQMPLREAFTSPETYYCTLFHECAHSTGHKSRLARKSLVSTAAYGSEDYSDEELCAEFAAAFLSAEAGISSDELLANSAAYIQGWLKKLKNDPKLAVFAAQRAQKAADMILRRNVAAGEGVAA